MMKENKPTLPTLEGKFKRQGDVIFKAIKKDAIPKELKKAPNNHVKDGEHSDHFHALGSGGEISIATDGTKYLELEQPTEVTHDEHNVIPLENDVVWQIVDEREYDMEKEVSRMVAD